MLEFCSAQYLENGWTNFDQKLYMYIISCTILGIWVTETIKPVCLCFSLEFLGVPSHSFEILFPIRKLVYCKSILSNLLQNWRF